MSQYTSFSVAFAFPSLIGAAARGAAHVVSSATLAAFSVPDALSGGSRSADPLACALNLRREIESRPAVGATLRSSGVAGRLPEAYALIDRSEAAARLGDSERARRLARRGDRLLRGSLATAAAATAVAERRLVTDGAHEALCSLGYAVQRHDGGRSAGLWATRDNSAVALLVRDGGSFELDTVGCAADSCRPVVAELISALRERGIVAERRETHLHGDGRGGQLVTKAARMTPNGPMAVGIVEQDGAPRISASKRREAAGAAVAVPEPVQVRA